ncbi:MAG: hypothetical protein HY721_02030 [Planctomycetes bacterium]|nr:hypothetical protein [Planctomycetota bacterium]
MLTAGPARPSSRARFVLVGILYLLAAVMGVRGAIFRELQPIDLLLRLTLGVVVTMACVADARSLGKGIVLSAQWLILLTWPVSVPSCLIWARGAKDVWLTLVHGTLLIVLCTTSYVVTRSLTFPEG